MMKKGYPVNQGYRGYINGKYMLFETEEAYKEFLSEYSNEKEFLFEYELENQRDMYAL